jgi:hypothetical protein
MLFTKERAVFRETIWEAGVHVEVGEASVRDSKGVKDLLGRCQWEFVQNRFEDVLRGACYSRRVAALLKGRLLTRSAQLAHLQQASRLTEIALSLEHKRLEEEARGEDIGRRYR